MEYLWANPDGKITKEEYNPTTDVLSREQAEEILKNAFKNFNHTVDFNQNQSMSEIYDATIGFADKLEKKYIICMKGTTPGGRNLNDEQRIQQSASKWNFALKTTDKIPVLLGVYMREEEPIICAWKMKSSESKNPISKQVKIEVIAKAYETGFAQEQFRNSTEMKCAFRPEFLYFYLENISWIHDIKISNLDSSIKESENLINQDENHSYTDKVGSNIVFYGAPGTGKSWQINQEIKKTYPMFEDVDSEQSDFVYRVTFHPEYTYSDFTGQIMPSMIDGEIKYEFTPGIFTRALEKALSFEEINQPVYLVLEELSRANVAAVFGDLFQLLDRKKGISEYSISNPVIANYVYHVGEKEEQHDNNRLINKKIYLPKNLHLLGTVNTNDQNVFVMDTAFKRRFDWEYVSTKPVSMEGEYLNNSKFKLSKFIWVNWIDFYQKLNLYITKNMKLGEDKQVGQFFLKFENKENIEENRKQIQNKLLQYLWDDIEQASFTEKIFSNVDNYSDLYEKFKNEKEVFNNNFIGTLDMQIDTDASGEINENEN